MSVRQKKVSEVTDLRFPTVVLPRLPAASALWSRALVIGSFILALFLLDRVALLFMDYWLLESLGYKSVFWTNFRMGSGLFVVTFAIFVAAVAVPAYLNDLGAIARRRALQVGSLVGSLAAAEKAGHFLEYLLLFNGRGFGRTDPVFDHDIGFYVFDLHAIHDMMNTGLIAAAVLLVSAIVCAHIGRDRRDPPPGMRRLTSILATCSNSPTIVGIMAFGSLLAAKVFIGRYDILIKDNYDSSIANGADYLDVTGFFSTLNGYTVGMLALFFGTGALALRLRALNRAVRDERQSDWRRFGVVSLIFALLPGASIESGFRAMIALRNETQVTPNEPVVQLPYIKRHIDATRLAYGFDKVEEVEFVPHGDDDPLPNPDAILADPAFRDAPLWPGFVTWLERTVDPEYVKRFFRTGGESLIYGPTLEIYPQQQKLRPYYDFMDVDTVRYEVDGRDRLFATSVRELPLVEPQPWLAWWGQQFLLFTHGQGLVASYLTDVDDKGEPNYVSSALPVEAEIDAIRTDNPDVYYGEGSGSIGYSNVRQVPEHDYPTDEGRAETFYDLDVEAGVNLDSMFKRIVFGYKSRQFFDIVFSDLITDDTRVHYFRTPLDRIEHIAPFLFVDTDPYAVAAGDRIQWMVNGITKTDRYPYSIMGDLGDKSVRRSPTHVDVERVNYVADSVKITVDAYTGDVTLYKFADEPIVEAWDDIYPDLFEDASTMPDDIREQVQYPTQLFHLQFDDHYIYYHVTDPLTFFSFEDAYDDADEVIGPILAGGEAITFSFEPYYWMAATGTDLPSSAAGNQFALSMAFTPEGALNLRGISTAYMTGEDYGRLVMLQVPKGHFVTGPEQADAAIDQDAFISQQIGLWNRKGLEVIRGHTTPLIAQGELFYIEPLFIRSEQNPVPQLKRVVVVFRGRAFMGTTLDEAVRASIAGAEPLFGEQVIE